MSSDKCRGGESSDGKCFGLPGIKSKDPPPCTNSKKPEEKKCYAKEEKKAGDKCYTRIHVEEQVPRCKFAFLCPPVAKKDDGCKKGWFCKTCPLPKVDTTDICCVYKPLYKLGLLWIAILRHLLFPISCGSPIVYAKSNDETEANKSRASELPLYAERMKPQNVSSEPERSVIEETIGCARQELQILLSQGKVVKTQIDDFLISTSAKTKGALEYLQAEENIVPRYGAIALGGTAGYILALRKGLLKRLLYTTTGAAGVASLAYPREAKEVAGEALIQAKKYFVIGYHFINGVTTDLFGFQLPALPVGHLFITDKPHPPPDAVPSSAHLLPPVATPSHIPLPNEDPHTFEIKKLPKKD